MAQEDQVFVVLRDLHIQPEEDTQEVQRENIFYTKVHVDGKTCGLIIDSGSSVNIASQYMVDKLNLPVIPHPCPYVLYQLNEGEYVKVDQQVLVSINLGKYSDQVLCDVAPMNVSHLLFGKPWQFDRKALHDDYTNTIKFKKDGRKVVLHSLSPHLIHKDQLQIKKNVDEHMKHLAVASKELIENELAKQEDKENLVLCTREKESCDLSMVSFKHKDVSCIDANCDESFPSSSKKLLQKMNFHDLARLEKDVSTLFMIKKDSQVHWEEAQ